MFDSQGERLQPSLLEQTDQALCSHLADAPHGVVSASGMNPFFMMGAREGLHSWSGTKPAPEENESP